MAEEHELQSRMSRGKRDSDWDEEPHYDPQEILGRKLHWGLRRTPETILFYSMIIPAWILEICAGAFAAYYKTSSGVFIGCVTAFLVLHWAAWLQTAFAMIQRCSWTREETVEERIQFLWFAIRLQRMMIPTAIISFCIFIQAYARRDGLDDLAYWLLFLLFFIIDIVMSVMNAYNNITWEADQLWYEDRIEGVPSTYLAILGI